MKKELFILLGMMSLSLFACKKTDTDVPDVSPDGEYFNCKLDGSYWTYRQCDFCNADALYARPEVVDYPHFSIRAMSSEYPTTVYSFLIDTSAFNRLDTIDLGAASKSYVTVTHPYPVQAGIGSEFTSVSGRLIFTKKTASQVVGTFEFDATDGSNVAHITDGKFLIKRS